jgi:hypothetical protein
MQKHRHIKSSRKRSKAAMHKDQERKKADTASKGHTEEFDQAVERVYRTYGNDLSAFARDVQRDMKKNAEILRMATSAKD